MLHGVDEVNLLALFIVHFLEFPQLKVAAKLICICLDIVFENAWPSLSQTSVQVVFSLLLPLVFNVLIHEIVLYDAFH